MEESRTGSEMLLVMVSSGGCCVSQALSSRGRLQNQDNGVEKGYVSNALFTIQEKTPSVNSLNDFETIFLGSEAKTKHP